MSEMTVWVNGGYFVVTTAAYDAAMARYLPASPAELRDIVAQRTGETVQYYSNVTDVSAFIAMLADFDYNVDSSPLSVDAAHILSVRRAMRTVS